MKTVKVADKDGNKTIVAEQVGTFAYYIQGIQFRFLVTRLNRELTVTHRASGRRVTDIKQTTLLTHLNDAVGAARHDLKQLLEKAGEARVRSVLTAAEREA